MGATLPVEDTLGKVVRRELVAERYDSTLASRYAGVGTGSTPGCSSGWCPGAQCAAALGRNISAEDALFVGGNDCNIPLFRLDGMRVGTVTAVALWVFENYNSSAVVAAGLGQATAEVDPGSNTWAIEKPLLDQMTASKRFIIVNDVTSMQALTRDHLLAAAREAEF